MTGVQAFDRVARVREAEHRFTYSVKSPLAMFSPRALDVAESRVTAVLVDVMGDWFVKSAKPGGRASAERTYRVHMGPLGLQGARVTLYRVVGSRYVKEAEGVTDSDGKVSFDLSRYAGNPGLTQQFLVTLLPKPLGVSNPFEDVFGLRVWILKVTVKNRTDRWLRWVGRSFFKELPRQFWHYGYAIGLAWPWGTAYFADLAPILSGMEYTVEYGVSAWCNTPEPYPPHDKCVEYRRRTWWHVTVEAKALKGVGGGWIEKKAEADLNIDRHLRLKIKYDDIEAKVVRPRGAET